MLSSGPVPGLALTTSGGGEVGRAMGAIERGAGFGTGGRVERVGTAVRGDDAMEYEPRGRDGQGQSGCAGAAGAGAVPSWACCCGQPDGGSVVGAVILDARRGVRVRLDVPERLIVGDRTTLAVLVENDGDEPVVGAGRGVRRRWFCTLNRYGLQPRGT